MTRNIFIANRLREVFLNGKWIANTNYKEQLSGLNREQATKQIGKLNTIAMITFHVNYYLSGLINVLKGGLLDIKDKHSFDIPVFNTDEDWKKLHDEFLHNAEVFASLVENMPEYQLDESFVDEKYGTYLRNIEAVVEHSYYHLGQISLIKKLMY